MAVTALVLEDGGDEEREEAFRRERVGGAEILREMSPGRERNEAHQRQPVDGGYGEGDGYEDEESAAQGEDRPSPLAGASA